jgi:hypothetical protein
MRKIAVYTLIISFVTGAIGSVLKIQRHAAADVILGIALITLIIGIALLLVKRDS